MWICQCIVHWFMCVCKGVYGHGYMYTGYNPFPSNNYTKFLTFIKIVFNPIASEECGIHIMTLKSSPWAMCYHDTVHTL